MDLEYVGELQWGSHMPDRNRRCCQARSMLPEAIPERGIVLGTQWAGGSESQGRGGSRNKNNHETSSPLFTPSWMEYVATVILPSNKRLSLTSIYLLLDGIHVEAPHKPPLERCDSLRIKDVEVCLEALLHGGHPSLCPRQSHPHPLAEGTHPGEGGARRIMIHE